jgi:hypothetical protein
MLFERIALVSWGLFMGGWLGCFFSKGGDGTICQAAAAAATAFTVAKLGGFTKIDLVKGKESLGTGGYAASATAAAKSVNPGYGA